MWTRFRRMSDRYPVAPMGRITMGNFELPSTANAVPAATPHCGNSPLIDLLARRPINRSFLVFCTETPGSFGPSELETIAPPHCRPRLPRKRSV